MGYQKGICEAKNQTCPMHFTVYGLIQTKMTENKD
jgi:hypothetical protein